MLRVVTVDRATRARHAAGLAALERGTSYPLGADRFELVHGPDYFAFFDRLGQAVHEVVLDGDRVVAASCRVLRPRPFPCWYLCDLKVHPDYRGQRLAARIARFAFPRSYARCGRGYAVSMNEAGAGENRVARLVERLRLVPFAARELLVWGLDAGEVRRILPLVERHRGPVTFLSLSGKKDLLLESTGAPLPLLHLQFGPCAEPGGRGPRDGYQHMLCAPAGDPLALDLERAGAQPSASAVVLHHRMRGSGFEFVLTSDV